MDKARRDLIDKAAQREALVKAAQEAYDAGNQELCDSKLKEAQGMEADIERLKALVDATDKKFFEKAPDLHEEKEKAEELGNALMKGEQIKLSAKDVRKSLYLVNKAITLATGTIVQPTGAGSNIRDPLGNTPSSIVDQVYVQDLTGMGSFLEPYVISETDAQGGKVSTNAGKARTASSDPSLGVAKISPYELNVTNYVDRNIARLSPADYYNKIYGMAMRAFRRKLAELIPSGDGQTNPDMFGIKNAKNQAGAVIYASVDVTTVDENLLDTLFFAYGSDEAIGQNARLYLTKADLAAIGKLRNTDKQRVYKIVPDGGNPNSGTIEDGGTIIPYTIVPKLTSLSTATAGSNPIQTMLYGDPANYELGLFGDYSIRVDESIKGVERMYTILGDAMVGGNLIVDKGFVVATLPKTGG